MRTENVLDTMAAIVERRVELYKGDFYDYDTERIERERPREFAWFVRDTGTHMMTPPAEDADLGRWREVYELFKGCNERFYHVRMNTDGSGEVTLSERRCDEFAARMTAGARHRAA